MSNFQWGLFSRKALHSIQTSDARINLWAGAVRSSKTVSSQVRWLRYIHEAPPGPLLMAGVTIGTLKDNILDPLSEMVGPENYRYVAGSREVYICGRRILIRGANDEAAEKKIRGLTLAGVYGDEITLWPESFFRRCLDRMSVKGAKLFGTTNPDSPYHWLKTDYLDRESDLDLNSYHFELRDNPNLPPEYIDNLTKEFSGLWYKRFIQGLWVVAEGAVYDLFDEDLHVVEELPKAPFERVVIGVDYGTSNPTVFIALGLYQGVWYAFAEYRYDGGTRQHTDAEHADALARFIQDLGYTPSSIEIDPSAASFKAQLRRNSGVAGRNLKDADNEVVSGIRVVATALATNILKIHRSCTHLIKGFATYTWDPKAQKERGEDKPIKQNDHEMDALRYAAMRAIGRRSRQTFAKPEGT